MKKDKFCINRTIVYLVLLVLVGFGFFYAINYVNKQKLFNQPKATGVGINCSTLNMGSVVKDRLFYKKGNKYYKDSNYKYEITEGVANYCKANITSPPNCINVSYLYPTCKRPVYKKGDKFYIESSCQRIIVMDGNYAFAKNDNLLSSPYCTLSNRYAVPVAYMCPNSKVFNAFLDTNSNKFYFFLNNGVSNLIGLGTKIYLDNYGFGNYCKTLANLSGTPIPTNKVMSGLSQFRCKDILPEVQPTPHDFTRYVYANMSDFIKNNSNLNKVTFYVGSSYASAKVLNISYYCKTGVNTTPTPTPKP